MQRCRSRDDPDSGANDADDDMSDDDADFLDEEHDEWLDECAADAEEDSDMPGLYWVQLPRPMHVADMATLFIDRAAGPTLEHLYPILNLAIRRVAYT